MKRFSETSKRQIVEDYRSCCLSRSKFCQEKKISLTSLQRWLGLYKEDPKEKAILPALSQESRFVEAIISDHAEPRLSHPRNVLTIRTPGGYVIEVPV